MKYLLKRNIVKHYYKENKASLTTSTLQDMLTAVNNSLGVHGSILAVCIGFLIEDKKSIISLKNHRSRKRLIKWLFSEMRFYNDLGTFDTYTNAICKRILTVMIDRSIMRYKNENKARTD